MFLFKTTDPDKIRETVYRYLPPKVVKRSPENMEEITRVVISLKEERGYHEKQKACTERIEEG
jgi:hypothetical protein